MAHSSSAPSSLRTEVWIFFFAILILNSAFVAGIGEEVLPRGLYAYGRLVLLGGTLVAIIVMLRGFQPVLELIQPLFVWRISPLWFLAAFFLPIVFSVVFAAARSLLIGAPLDVIDEGGLGLFQRSGFLFNIFIIALVGEIVWVSYAIRNLSKFYSLQIAAIITGTFWTLWWLPMVIYQIGVIPGLSLSGLWMNMVGIAFFCAFFYTLTRSGLVILLMQFCFNSVILVVPVLPSAATPFAYQIFAALYMVLGFLALTVLLPRLQKPREIGSAQA